MNKLIPISVAAVLAALAPSSAAFAGDTTCLWRSLPERIRAGALATYDKNGNVGDALPDAAVLDAVKKCVPPPANAKRAADVVDAGGLALTAYVAQVGSETALRAGLHVDPAKLEQAWAQVKPGTRKSWADAFLSDAGPSEKVLRSIAEASVAVRPTTSADQLRKSPEFEHFAMYFGGRAMREQFETQF